MHLLKHGTQAMFSSVSNAIHVYRNSETVFPLRNLLTFIYDQLQHL